jgi:hypothetical protein
MGEIEIRRAGPDDASVLLELVDALADYEKLERPTPGRASGSRATASASGRSTPLIWPSWTVARWGTR